MKIAFTTAGENLEAPFDSHFGRAPKFLIYDIETKAFEVIDNRQNFNAAQGAGIQAAQTIVRAGVNCLVTGHCGPKAFHVLSAAGVKVYNIEAATVAEALKSFNSGNLKPAASPNVEGHWA